MSSAYARKKQPEIVRRALLDSAAKLAAEHGLSGMTVQAVAEAAGVTKGGLFHHFASKEALVEAMVADLLARIDAELDALIEKDPERHGVFTRAYVECIFAGSTASPSSSWASFSVAMAADPWLREMWVQWFEGRLSRHRDTDDDPTLEIVRLAADGAWFLSHSGEDRPAVRLKSVRDRLLALTHAGRATLTA